MPEIQQYQSFYLGSESRLSEHNKRYLLSCFRQPVQKTSGRVLDGRAAISRIHLENIGPVVVKRYARGGLIRKFNRHSYLKISKFRCQAEYELLLSLHRIGVNVPSPVAFAYRKKNFFYHAWLITREICHARTLAAISLTEADITAVLMRDLERQVNILVQHHIHHVDLHPGNVLVDASDRLFLIDFDKARTMPQNRMKLKKKYIQRWQRAIVKYQLPDVLRLFINDPL